MRSAALCLLAIAAPACNWVFGIEDVLQVDAALPADAVRPIARLRWLVAVTDGQGMPTSSLEQHPIVPTPTVKIGRLGQPLMDVAIDETGTITLPEGYESSPWRLEYQLAGDVPREIQWSMTAERTPQAIVPRFGRLERTSIPGANTVMTMTPSDGMPGSHVGPVVFTTGIWTQSVPTFGFPAGPTFNQNLNASVQLSGPPGAPDHTKGDLVVLSDYATSESCRRSVGSAVFKLALTDGPSTTITAEPWRNSARTTTVTGPASDVVRVGLAASTTTSNVTTVVQVGPAASSTMPAFTQEPGAERAPRLELRGPLLLPMLDCTNAPLGAPLTYNLPPSLSTFDQMAHIQVTADRTVPGGPNLTHGLVAVRLIAANRADFDINVAMPLSPFLLGTLDLSTTDDVPLPAGTDPLVLTFMTETTGISDYFEVVLHRVTGTSTTPERVYTIQQPALTIDRGVFTMGTDYVFEIRAFRGAPDARFADFTRYDSTQASAVVWTRTFEAR
ncbi:MAG: hypothetical protein H0T42_18500 [Deltaproteobacteria bacterium]|nr:hypothetical protein [Deltaproteobacteria bacterium]